jgi:hypothetical protein
MQRAAQLPFNPHPTSPTVRAAAGASATEATAATAPVRSAVTAAPSISASGMPVCASERQTTPVTVGRPWRGLPGNDATHFSSA